MNNESLAGWQPGGNGSNTAVPASGAAASGAVAPSGAVALRVLILEDLEADAVLMARALRKAGYLVAWNRVDTEEAYTEALRGGDFDVVLSDFSLPSFNAHRALAIFQEMRLETPFIVVTGSLGEEQAVELIKMGASDYLIKDRLGRLGGAVSTALEQKRLRDEARQALERLRDSEERLQRIAGNLPDIIYRIHFDPALSFDYLSPAVASMTGYSPDEIYANPLLVQEIFRPEDIDRLAVQLRLPRFFEQPLLLRAVRKDGRTFWMELRNAPVYDAAGNICAFEGVGSDVTQRVLRDREREAMMAAGSALRDLMTRAEMLPVILREVSELAGASAAAVGMTDDSGMHPAVARIEAASGKWKDWPGARLTLSPGMTARVLGEGRSFLVEGAQVRRALPAAEALDGLRELICVPLKAKDEVLGLLWVGTAQEMSELEEGRMDRLRLIEAVSDIAAGALNRARLYEETQHRLQHLTALRTIDRAITSSLDLHLTLNVLLDQLMAQKNVSGADVLLLDPYSHRLGYAGTRGYRRRMDGASHRVGDSLAGCVALDRRMLVVENLTTTPLENAQRLALLEEGFHAYLGLPLIAKGDLLGVLEILRHTAGPFEPAELEFTEALAGQVAIAINNAELFEKLQRSTHEVVQAYDATIEGWSRALETRELETRGHTQRVVRWTTLLGKALGLGDGDLVHLRRGALLHDIGKMALPDDLLLKPGPLTAQEWELMQRHPIYAFEWLSPIIYLRQAMEIPYCHHEWWDGSGYPRGLSGAMIPLSARVFAVVDAFDALQSHRPYRAPWTREKTLAHLRAMAGSQFDPQVVETFLSLEDVGRFGELAEQ